MDPFVTLVACTIAYIVFVIVGAIVLLYYWGLL
jgi:hypothetical protein